jgi:Holliday junction resolvase
MSRPIRDERAIVEEAWVRDLDEQMSEKRFQSQVVELLKAAGWRCYHPFDSRRSTPGFPDITAVRGDRLLFLELKSLDGKVTNEQVEWLTALRRVKRVDAVVVRPSRDWRQLERLVA